MKKLFSLLTLALLTMSAWAETVVEFDLTTGYTNEQEVTTVAKDGVTLTFDKGSNNNAPKWYSTGTAVRLYGGSTLNIASSGDNITEVVFTFSGTGNTMNSTAASTVTAGTYTEDGTTGTWVGDAKNFTITRGGTSGHARIQNIKVTLGGQVVTVVADPTFQPADGATFTDTQLVTLNCATAGAVISYSIDNKATWNTYSEPFTINATTTVYAKAALNGVESNEVSATYTKVDAPVGGDEVTVDFSAQGYTNAQDFDGQTVNINGITLSFSKGEGSTTPKYYTSGTAMRLYTNNTMTVTAPAGKVITNIAFTYDSGSWDTTSPSVGTYSTTDAAWIGNAASIVFTNNKSSQVRIVKMVVTLADASDPTPTVAAPVFDPASGHQFTGSLTVTMTSATEGANIVYTVNNGDEVTAASPASVTIDADATISAFAQKDGVNSATVTATYTLKPAAQQVEYLEIAADLADDVEFQFTGNAVVTYQYNQYLFIKDETGYGLIYGQTNGGQNPKFAVGTMLSPGWVATVDIFENLHEFTKTTGLDSCGITTVTPEIITANQIPDKLNALVKIEHVKKVENGVATLIDGTTVTLFKRFDAALPTFDNADATITGIASVYGTTYQIYFISAEGAVNAPVITPASCNFEESQVVTITADEGAAIKYSTDEQATWNDYSEPLTITATTTVYAKAVKDGQESIVVSATYTKLEPVTYTLVTDVAQLAAGDKIILVGYCNKEGDDNYGKAYAMAEYRGDNRNNFAGVEVSVEDNTVTTVKANVITLETAAIDSLWNLKAAEGYLYAYSSDANNMRPEAEVDADGNANALIYMATDSMSISFQGTNTRNFLRFNYNNGTPLFSCYKVDSSIQTPAYIFKAQAAGLRGDVNNDTFVNISDVTVLIDYLLNPATVINEANANVNLDQDINISDVTTLIDFLLSGTWPNK